MSCADSVDFHFELLSRSTTAQPKEQHISDADGDESVRTPALSRSDKIPQGNTISEARTQGLATAFSGGDNPVQVFRLHGSLQQITRTNTLKAFTKCKLIHWITTVISIANLLLTATEPAVLVCTDVAARGLDLPNVDLVIEYDAPFSRDDHLHRIGRTARAGKEGRAMIFLMPGCEETYVDILKEGQPHNLTRHDAAELLNKGFSGSKDVAAEQNWEDRATDLQLDVERWALEHPKHLEQARRAFQSHVRAYATHVSTERAIFDMKQLHLGHLAKAFALRDTPGSINVPGLRPGAKAKKTVSGTKRPRHDDDDIPAVSDEHEARKRMRAKMKAMGGASEFNLG